MNFIYCAGYEFKKNILKKQGSPFEVKWVENINITQIEDYNRQGYGIYKSINKFEGERKIQSDSKICSWAIDIDNITKERQIDLIKYYSIVPSMVVDSGGGFHIYFHVDGEASKEKYKTILEDYLIPMYQADKGAKDITRVLRVANTKHWKNENPYMVKKIYSSNRKYSEDLFLKILKSKYKPKSRQIKPIIHQSRQTITASEIAFGLGNKSKRYGDSYMVCCPAHDDRHPSCRITQKEGKVLVNCISGCSQKQVISALRERGLWTTEKS